MNLDPAPGREPRFAGPLGYVLRSACCGGTRVDIIPFVADEPADAIQPVLNERIYTRVRPEGADLHAVVGWRWDESAGGIAPDMTVYADREDTLSAHPALRERARAFESAEVRKFPVRSQDERRWSIHGAVYELPPYHSTPGLFLTGFGEEMPSVRVTPLEMGGCSLLFERHGYRFLKKGTFLHASARHRPLRPGLLEIRPEGSGFALVMHPGSDPRNGAVRFDGFPHFSECLGYAQEVAAAESTRSRPWILPVRRATVGKTPGKTPSGLQVYTLQYLRGGVTADIVPFFTDGDTPERVYVRFASRAAESHAVAEWVREDTWGRRFVITPFDDRESLSAAYPVLREAVEAAGAQETWRLPPFHPIQDVFQQWRCRNRPRVTVAPAERGSVCSVAFESRMPWEGNMPRVIGAAGTDGVTLILPGEHPGLAADLEYGRGLFRNAGTVQWQDVVPGSFGATPRRSNGGLQTLPMRDEDGQESLLIQRGADQSAFTLITWPEGEEAGPENASRGYLGVEDILRAHPELEASLICANQRLVMDCRHVRTEGSW
ncbi:hypothetical protein FGU65_01585 [Methanoculleus sp. FWC-SCC1]|uniref:Uncharacterized protein n=1 Tax=Methanoculleus frigidifontis TaxID=2584085 RepID=A0ABT8M6R4_9EURY|nr:hypothetical protein [Methanoculleus sp. FWC-SCC1]MDN7023601.1 hypothetical protein [Methanoculleus sp. FWC-SCC1]